MHYLYYINIGELYWPNLHCKKKFLPITEQNYIETFKYDQDKIRSLIGRMLLLYILKKHINFLPDTLPYFTYNKYKKPQIIHSLGGFNISHAGNWVICGYNTQGDIGVDIEQIAPINLADYREVLTPSESQSITHGKISKFFQLWTLKEAVIKADGRGFFLSPTSFEIPNPFKNNSQIMLDNKLWFLYSFLIDQNYYIAIASSLTFYKKIQIKQLYLNENELFPIELSVSQKRT